MLADQLCTKGIISANIRDNVKGRHRPIDKNRVLIEAIQQQVDVNPGSIHTFIDALKMDKCYDTVVSLLISKKGPWVW